MLTVKFMIFLGKTFLCQSSINSDESSIQATQIILRNSYSDFNAIQY